MVSVELSDRLRSIYYTPSEAGSFGGVENLYKSVKKDIPKVKREDVRVWLKSQEAYGVHYPFRAKMPKSRVIVKGIDYMWDMDLMDMSLLSQYNDNVKYILLVIDVFSKYVWTYSMVAKTGDQVVKDLKDILNKSNRKPKFIRTDKGKEFLNKNVKEYLIEIGVKHIVTQSEMKASIAERAIKTIKGKLYKYMYFKQTYRYLPILNDVTQTYNKTYHSTIKMSPESVNKKNENKLWWEVYASDTRPYINNVYKKKLSSLNIGQYVRVSFLRGTFAREYRQKWSPEIFQIYQRFSRDGIYVYWIRDLGGEPILGSFYREELQLVKYDANSVYKIEKVIKTKKNKKGEKLYYVKWLNWGDKFNSWVHERDFVNI